MQGGVNIPKNLKCQKEITLRKLDALHDEANEIKATS